MRPLDRDAWRSSWLGLAAMALLAGCEDRDCSVAGEQAWLRDYMASWYLWADRSPSPAPDGARASSFLDLGEDTGFGLFIKGYTGPSPIVDDHRIHVGREPLSKKSPSARIASSSGSRAIAQCRRRDLNS